MKETIKNIWVKALRSGQYQQGKMFLQKNNTFCCLGVLCDIMQKETGDLSIRNQNVWDKCVLYNEVAGSLPIEVRDWAGMWSCDGSITERTSLTSLNDSNNKTFEEIAEVIEEQWEIL